MTTDLTRLASNDVDGALRVVVEAPRGSMLKLEYDDDLRAFTVGRALPLGMAYPFDWGFIPGTRAPDGDPVDALVIHPAASYPGVVLPCRLLGMVELEQRDRGKPWELNNRLITTPAWHEPLHTLREARDLPKNVQHELENFFVAVTTFTNKTVRILGWASRKKAQRYMESTRTRSDVGDQG